MLIKLKRLVKRVCWETSEMLAPSILISSEDIETLSNQIIALLIVRGYQNDPKFQKPLYSYIRANDLDDNAYAEKKRALKKWGGRNKNERNQFRAQGFSVPELPELESKRKGFSISPSNFRELDNLSASPITQLIADIDKGRITDIKKVDHTTFIEEFEDYERWCSSLQENCPDEQKLLYIIDFFILQGKLQIDLWVQVAAYMEQHNIEKISFERVYNFWLPISIPPLLSLEPNQVLYWEKSIPYVFTAIEGLFNRESLKCGHLRHVQAKVLNHLTQQGIYKEMNKNLTVEDKLSFFEKDYNMFEHRQKTDFGIKEHPNRKRINLFRNLIKEIKGSSG